MVGDAVEWVLRLGDDYGVDPLLYALIWVGSLPFFLLSLAWLVRALRRRESVPLALGVTAFFFLAPTLYVLLAGRNLPGWAYVLVVGLAVLGAITTIHRVRMRLRS